MFILRPLPKNRPTPVPYPFVNLNSNMRFITTNDVNYSITDSSVYFIRLNSSQEKTLTLPAGVDGKVLVIQDIGGNTADNPVTIKCTSPDQFLHTSTDEWVVSTGAFVAVIKYRGASYEIVNQRQKWGIEFADFGVNQPNLIPVGSDDSVVEYTGSNNLLLLTHPLRREIVIEPPSIPEGETTHPIVAVNIIDGCGTAGAYPLTFRFEGCSLNGNTSFVATGNNGIMTIRSTTTGNWEYLGSSGFVFSEVENNFTNKIFGFVNTEYPYYSSNTRGFSTTHPISGGVFVHK